MTWLQKLLPPRIQRTPGDRRTPVPEGLWDENGFLRNQNFCVDTASRMCAVSMFCETSVMGM